MRISLCAVSLISTGKPLPGSGALAVLADGRFRHLRGRRTSRAERTTAPSERRMWLLKGQDELGHAGALAHANLWEAKAYRPF